MTFSAPAPLVLASTSRYRRELLSRLTPHFRQVAPHADETPHAGETAGGLAARLAASKARAVAARCPESIVIGSDQAAECDGVVIGKPGSIADGCAQLAAASGRVVVFHTALCVVDTRGGGLLEHAAVDITRVFFRGLDADEIERYMKREQPLDCAGSFKAEGLGIALFERIESQDPTALIGLPLIALCRLLRAAGVALI